MKKTLVALAALASVSAFAQSSVTIYGIIDQSVAQTTGKLSTPAGGSKLQLRDTGVQSGLATQRIGFKGTEDLGGGNTALFQIENALSAGDAGTNGFGSRPTFVGLSGAMGTLTLGRQDTPMLKAVVPQLAGGANNAVGQIMWSNFVFVPSRLNAYTVNTAATVPANGWGRVASQATVDNAINYLTPTVGGVNAEFQAAQSKANRTVDGNVGSRDTLNTANAAGAQSNNFGANVKYANGPLTLNAATYQSKQIAASIESNKNVNNYVGATYALGSTVLSLQHGTDHRTNAGADVYKNRGTQFGFQTPVSGALNAFGSYGLGKRIIGANADVGDVYKQRSYQLGLGYGFSKRTTLYTAYGYQALKGDNDITTGTKYKETQAVVGLNHSF